MNTCFIASGPIEFASARYRAYWPAQYMKDTVAISAFDNKVYEADNYIWQKRYDLNFIKANQDKRHFIDFCDPMWWFSPNKVKELIQHMTGFVACTRPLADDFENLVGKNVIAKWDVRADNAQPNYGVTSVKDIKIVKRTIEE